MALNIDLYNHSERLEKGLQEFSASNDCRKQDKADITDYLNEMSAQGITAGRVQKQLYVLRSLTQLTDKTLRKCEKKDIMSIVRKIDAVKTHSDWTKYERKVILKRFYRWMNGGEKHPEKVEWLKLKEPKNSILPEDLLTEEEVIKLIDSAKYIRDKTFISALYESGCRIGEMLTLQIKNVSFGQHVTALLVAGKTGQRRVPLVTSTTYLSMWIQNHPYRDNPEAPLWVNIVDKWHPKTINHMSYEGVKKMLRVTFNKAGIKKRHNPHMFRHSRATVLANNITEAQSKQYFGWTQSSDMAARYVHLSGRDVDSAIMKMHGINTVEEEEQIKIKQISCPRCSCKNPSNFKLCQRCGGALSIKSAVELQADDKGNALEFMQSMLGDIQKLQGQGVDLQEFGQFMKVWLEKKQLPEQKEKLQIQER